MVRSKMSDQRRCRQAAVCKKARVKDAAEMLSLKTSRSKQMVAPGASYITKGQDERRRVETETSKRRRDEMMSRQWCGAVTGRIPASKQGQTFPNARCAREEMVPSQVVTGPHGTNALACCCGTGLRCHLASSVAVCLGSEGRHRPRARLRAGCAASMPASRPRGPALLSNGADRRIFPCDVILHPAARITAKFYVQTRPSQRLFKRTVDVAPCMMSESF